MAITAQFFAARAATGFGKELRSSLFGKIQSLSFSELDTLGRSSLITRMTNDVTQAQNGVNLVLRLFLRSPFIVLGATVMAFTIDVRCALIFVVVIAALSLVVFGIMGLTMPGYKNVQRQLDRRDPDNQRELCRCPCDPRLCGGGRGTGPDLISAMRCFLICSAAWGVFPRC